MEESHKALYGNLLDTADVCGLVLQDVLNNVLGERPYLLFQRTKADVKSDFGKLELASAATPASEQKEPEKRWVSLSRLVIETMEVSRLRRRKLDALSESGPEQDFTMHAVTDPEAERHEALVDVAGLQRVLLNLLTNSAKYTNHGSIECMSAFRTVESSSLSLNSGDTVFVGSASDR